MSTNGDIISSPLEDELQLSELSSSSDSLASSESIAAEYHSVSNSNENILHNFQCYILRRNASLIRKLSLQASNATTDFETFKRWVYQDLEKHRTQLQEAGSSLFYRNESKYDIPKYDLVITFVPHTDSRVVDQLQRALLLEHPALLVEHGTHYFANYQEDALYVSASDDFFHTYCSIADPCSQADCFSGPFWPDGSVTTSLQRQTILQSILLQWHLRGEHLSEQAHCAFEHLSRHVLAGQPVVSRLVEAKVIDQMFALHQEDELDHLKQSWVSKFFSSQPLDKICEYFGVKIAIYFAFIGFYTKSLLFPTFFGVFLCYFPLLLTHFGANLPEWLRCHSWMMDIEQDLLNDMLLFAFTIFNMFWSTIMLQKWQLSCKQYADRWSALLPFKVTLPQVHQDTGGKSAQCTLSGMVFKYCVTFPTIGCSLAITFTVMFHVFRLQTWWDSELIEKHSYPSWTRFGPKILLALIINTSNYIYYIIAVWLNNKEKYCSSETKENNLILKLVLFQFLNSFLPLFYLAFYIVDVNKLQEQLAAQLITRQVIGNFNEAVWPFLKESYRIATRKMHNDRTTAQSSARPEDKKKTSAILSKGELESCMYCYESTFDDYLELVVQFGYVMLFAPVFPMAALCAFLNNLIEIRSDAFKLCYVYKRPFGSEPAHSIGEWANVLHYLSIAAIATNCSLMVVTGQISRLFPFSNWIPNPGDFLVGVAIEHSLLLIKWLIPNLI